MKRRIDWHDPSDDVTMIIVRRMMVVGGVAVGVLAGALIAVGYLLI